MKNLFLSGPRQVGKSTLIMEIVSNLPQIVIGGYQTRPFFETSREIAGYKIHSLLTHDSQTIARRNNFDNSERFIVYTSAFDQFGGELLKAAVYHAELIIMDEIGTMESRASQFQATILECLESRRIVLGVIKQKDSDFLNQLRNRKDLDVLEVTSLNREQVREELDLRIKRLVQRDQF